MTRAWIRPLLAGIAVAAVFSHGLLGHGPSQLNGHDGMTGVTVGLCLLLVTVLAYAAVPKPDAAPTRVLEDLARPHVGLLPPSAPDGRARASPTALQRFRN